MITKLLTKQLEAELEFIYENMIDFIVNFYEDTDAEVTMIEEDLISYYVAFTHHHIYIQKHWLGSDGESRVQESNIDYPEYNQWCEDVLNV